MSGTVVVEREAGVVRARLDNPGRGNAMSPDMVRRLTDLITGLTDEPEIHALVLTGSRRAFCGGADVTASAALADPAARLTFLESGRTLVETLSAAPVPVIAALNGPAFAGGLELALACDIVLAVESVVVGDRHLVHGRLPGWGALHRLLARCGRLAALDLVLTGAQWDARTAAAHGLITRIVPDGTLDDAVTGVLDQLAQVDPALLRRAAALLRDLDAHPATDHPTLEWRHFAAHFTSGDPGTVRFS